ncbi:MAG: hypothetical protein K9N09_01035 [Candidatus Cloacimonetes bacterium]|nr:hypothetical protein [Candidatus Cloacimonadota bacterium]MCF7813009.1 hypothetical protein [Candidatus Cloacimonadota bacterium]MCF7867259.1 hypothetical protein [Candidatus Cloacimonadota bacterium]MCF7882703.1 hypothetical protein [Candidatus Cloacimonadota bacterium]
MNVSVLPMTNENIDYLITCEKEITEIERKDFKIEQGHKKNSFKLKSKDKKYEFYAFMRINEEFSENFSIGLIFHPFSEKSIMLFRCNGPHNHKERPNSEHHNNYHYHYEIEENILEDTNPMNHSKIVKEYSTFPEAFQFFIKYCKIQNAEDFFPNLTEPVFGFMED